MCGYGTRNTFLIRLYILACAEVYRSRRLGEGFLDDSNKLSRSSKEELQSATVLHELFDRYGDPTSYLEILTKYNQRTLAELEKNNQGEGKFQ